MVSRSVWLPQINVDVKNLYSKIYCSVLIREESRDLSDENYPRQKRETIEFMEFAFPPHMVYSETYFDVELLQQNLHLLCTQTPSLPL